MRKLAIAAIAFGLTACGSVPEAPTKDQEAELNAKQLCCEEFGVIRYEALALKAPKRAILDSNADVRQFAQGRSYFKAFEIPEAPAQGLWIKSYFNGLFIKQYLQPLALFLDADYKPLGTAVPRLQFQDGNIFGDRNARMEGGVRVPANARYLLVFTTSSFPGVPDSARTAPSTGAFLVGNTPVITTNPGKTIGLERSVTGELSLELEDISTLK